MNPTLEPVPDCLKIGDWQCYVGSHEPGHDGELIRLEPRVAGLAESFVTSLLLTGKEALREGEQIMAANPEFSIQRMMQAFPFKNPGDIEHFVAGLRLAGLKQV
jgi:hypothetical protein